MTDFPFFSQFKTFLLLLLSPLPLFIAYHLCDLKTKTKRLSGWILN